MRRGKHGGHERFGTTFRDMEKAFKAEFPDHPPHPLFEAPLLSNAEIHKELRDGAKWYRAGVAIAAGNDDPTIVESGLRLMRGGIWRQLDAVVNFCMQNMDYRSADALQVLCRHREHVLDLMRGIQAPYLLKAAPNGNPDPIDKIYHKAACVAARDWLERYCGFSPKEAKELVLTRVKDLKKATLETWRKPHSRASMDSELQEKVVELHNTARLCVRMGDNDIRIVLDRFLERTNGRSPGRSSVPSNSRLGNYLRKLDDELKEGGFARIDTIARQ